MGKSEKILYGRGGAYVAVKRKGRLKVVRVADDCIMVHFNKDSTLLEASRWVDTFMMKKKPWEIPEMPAAPKRKYTTEGPLGSPFGGRLIRKRTENQEEDQ